MCQCVRVCVYVSVCASLCVCVIFLNFVAPFEKFWYAGKEEVRPEGDIMIQCREKSPANYIVWIIISSSNIMH